MCLTSILPQNAYDISSKLVPGIIECVPYNLKWLESAKYFSSNKKRAIWGINKSSGISILLWRSYSSRWLFVILLKKLRGYQLQFCKDHFPQVGFVSYSNSDICNQRVAYLFHSFIFAINDCTLSFSSSTFL